jgi:methylated-DNA-[protein]-cysteine S-methyltransferase
MDATIYTLHVQSPLGMIEITGTESAIASLNFVDSPGQDSAAVPPLLRACAAQLAAYFLGERREFDLRLAPSGTDFQRRVWQQLLTVPFGATATYGHIAQALGNPKTVRAVGAANGQNPISIIIPCHRIIGSDGQLTGYGGGLWRKEWLLNHERKFTVGEQMSFEF